MKESMVSKEPSPVRTARHVLLIADPVEGEGEVDKGCACQSECWNRWLPKDIPLTRKEHDVYVIDPLVLLCIVTQEYHVLQTTRSIVSIFLLLVYAYHT